jgi:hypothetical protein
MSETATAEATGTVVTIPVVTCMIDGQDGGYTMNVYGTKQEMVDDHFDGEEPTEEEIQYFLDGEDEYENGYIGSDTIQVEVMADGSVKLASSLSFHAGQ